MHLTYHHTTKTCYHCGRIATWPARLLPFQSWANQKQQPYCYLCAQPALVEQRKREPGYGDWPNK